MKYRSIASLLLTAVIALGTVNPFSLQGGEDIYGSVQQSPLLMPVLVLFIIVVLTDKKCTRNKKILSPLLSMLIVLGSAFFLGDVFFDINGIDLFTIFKYFVAVTSFCTFLLFYYTYPNEIQPAVILYCTICVVLILGYFSGILAPFAHFNNGRLILFGENPNSTSSRIGLAAIFFIHLIVHGRFTLVAKVLFFLGYASLAVYIVLSGSRGTFALVGLFSLVIARKYIFKRVWISAPLILLAIIFAIRFLSSWDFALFNRFEDLENGNNRTELMENAIIIFKSHPLFGAGINGYEVEKLIRGMDHHDSHCIATSIMAMGGLTGIIAFLSFIIASIRRIGFKGAGDPLMVFLYLFFIALKTGGAITWILMWYTFALSIAMGSTNYLDLSNQKSRFSSHIRKLFGSKSNKV